MPGANCSIVYCGTSRATNKVLSFFKIRQPKNPEWEQALVAAVNRSDTSFNINRATICSRHFTPECLKEPESGRSHLVPGSLPTLWMPTESPETPRPPSRKVPKTQATAESITSTGPPTRRRKPRTGNACIVPGCKVKQKDKEFSMHMFPADPKLRKKWIKFISAGRRGFGAKFVVPKYSSVCSRHFEPECFPDSLWLKRSMGIRTHRYLNPGSVPTILKPQPLNDHNAETAQGGPAGLAGQKIKGGGPETRVAYLTETSERQSLLAPKGVKSVRAAYQKRERRRIIDALLAGDTDNPKDSVTRQAADGRLAGNTHNPKDSVTSQANGAEKASRIAGNTYTPLTQVDGISIIYVQPKCNVQPKWQGKYEQSKKAVCNISTKSTVPSHDALMKKAWQSGEEFCPLVLEVESDGVSTQQSEGLLECTEEVMDEDTVQTQEPEVEVKWEPDLEFIQEPEVEVKWEPDVEFIQEPEVEVKQEPEVEVKQEPDMGVIQEPKLDKVEVKQEPEVELDIKREAELNPEQAKRLLLPPGHCSHRSRGQNLTYTADKFHMNLRKKKKKTRNVYGDW